MHTVYEPEIRARLGTAAYFCEVVWGGCLHHEIPGELASRAFLRLRGGFVFKAHRLWYHSTLGLRVIKKKKKPSCGSGERALAFGSVRFEG